MEMVADSTGNNNHYRSNQCQPDNSIGNFKRTVQGLVNTIAFYYLHNNKTFLEIFAFWMHPPEKRNRILKKRYSYSYDPLNRIISAIDDTSDQRYSLTNIEYDRNGNIQKLKRNGHTNTGATSFGVMDDLTYSYTGNQLQSVTDLEANTGFKDGNQSGADYSYDANANMKSDANKGITSITYNHLNLPEQVNFGSQNIQYVYDATGAKLKRTSSTGTETLYAGNHIYEGAIGNAELQFFNHPEGYATPNGQGGYDYIYNYIDHLGSVRLSYTDADGNGSIDPANEIIEENNYYAFGLKMRGFNDIVSPYGNSAAKRWKYSGKEFDESLDIDTYDFGARNYDPTIGRWMNVDPLAEEYDSWSPYHYVYNNPILLFDPDGRLIVNGATKGSDEYKSTESALAILRKTNPEAYNTLQNSSTVYRITYAKLNPADAYKTGFVGTFKKGETNATHSVDSGLDATNITRDADGNVSGGELERFLTFEEQEAARADGSNPNGVKKTISLEEAANFSSISGDVQIKLDGTLLKGGLKELAAILGHEFGHAALTDENSPLAYLWSLIDDDPNGQGHGANNPSGQRAKAEESKTRKGFRKAKKELKDEEKN